jgi:SP family xylose:H+ symportor-like MFS transporter
MQPATANYIHSYILFIAFVSALGGYRSRLDFAIKSGTLPFLKLRFQLTALGESFLTGWLALGCMCGCLIAGKLADQYGGRSELLVS